MSSFVMMKNYGRKSSLRIRIRIKKRRRRRCCREIDDDEREYDGGKNKKNKKMMMMIWNCKSRCSVPILKRHKKKNKMMAMAMDEDLIGTEDSSSSSSSRRSTTTICDLAEEVLTEVLVRLCVKDILHCLCVQKSWLSLIKNPTFITLYNNNNNNNAAAAAAAAKYLLFWYTYSDDYDIRVDDIQCPKYLTLNFPPQIGDSIDFPSRLVSNGLICTFKSTFQLDNAAIYLWNPIIQKYHTLPTLPHHLPYSTEWPCWKAIAFGFLPQVNDYVVVCTVKYALKVEPHTLHFITCVYTLNTNSWRIITHHNHLPDVNRVDNGSSFIVNGIAVWSGYNSKDKRIIMCFDTKTDVLRHILLPNCPDTDSFFPIIYPFGQSVVYFAKSEYSYYKVGMWVSKGDLMNEQVLWEKKVSVSFKDRVKAHVLGLRNNGDPILCNSFDMISFNLDNYKSYDFVTSWDRWTPGCWWDGCDSIG